jgi:hypothetical protein
VSPEIEAEAIDADFVAVARSDVTSVELDGELVLYDDAARVMHRLNPTASMLWACLDGSGSLAEIAADVASAYGADVVQVCSDLVAASRHLGRMGLVVGVRRSQDAPGFASDQESPPAPPGGPDAGVTPGADPAGDGIDAHDIVFVPEPPSP